MTWEEANRVWACLGCGEAGAHLLRLRDGRAVRACSQALDRYYATRAARHGCAPPIAEVREAVRQVGVRYAAGARPYVGAPGTGACRGSRTDRDIADRAAEIGWDAAETEATSGFCATCGAAPEEDCRC